MLEETVLGGVAWVLHQQVASGKAAQAPSLHGGLLESLLSPYLGRGQGQRDRRQHLGIRRSLRKGRCNQESAWAGPGHLRRGRDRELFLGSISLRGRAQPRWP